MLKIIADIRAVPGEEAFVEAELRKLIPITVAEAGCKAYELWRDEEDPTHFVFDELWESRELWQAHMKAPHLAAYSAATEGKVAAFSLLEAHRVA